MTAAQAFLKILVHINSVLYLLSKYIRKLFAPSRNLLSLSLLHSTYIGWSAHITELLTLKYQLHILLPNIEFICTSVI